MSRERATLLAAILGSGMVFLDTTVVNVALPAMRDDLDAGLAAQQWIVEAFLLTLGALLLVGGSLGDLLGRRRVFVAGTIGFGAASLACALAPSAGLLVGARAVQGAAGALLVPSTLALIMDTFPVDRRSAAIGTWTAWAGVGTVAGPVLGGFLVDHASWRWIFAINVPAVALVLVLARRLRPDAAFRRATVDWLGAGLAGFGLAGVIVGLIGQPTAGWGAVQTWAPLTAGIVLLAGFVAWERRAPAPMLPPGLFAERDFAVGNLATLAVYAGLGGGLFLLVIHLQQTAGYTALAAGLTTLPITALMLLLSRRFGSLADRFGARWLLAAGPVVAGSGFLLLTRLGAEVGYAKDLLPGVGLFGLGLAMTVAPLTATVLGAVPAGRSGVASGVNNAVARVASLLAIAAVGAVAAAGFSARVEAARATGVPAEDVRRALERPMVVSGDPELRRLTRAAAVEGFQRGIGLAGALVIAGGLVCAVGIASRPCPVPARDCPGGPLVGAPERSAA